jgi:hypothetical protein
LTDLHAMVQYHYYDAVNAILSANAEADLEARLRDVVRVTPLVSALTGPPAAAELMVPSDVNPVYGRVNRAETVRVLCRWGVKVDAGAEMGALTALCQASSTEPFTGTKLFSTMNLNEFMVGNLRLRCEE